MRDRAEQAFLKGWHALNDVDVGNCAAVPGHLAQAIVACADAVRDLMERYAAEAE